MKNPQPLSELDLADYAKFLETKGYLCMEPVLNKIVSELTSPFEDKRGEIIQPGLEDVFYQIFKESSEEIRIGKHISCKIKGCYMTTLNARTESGINCNIQNVA